MSPKYNKPAERPARPCVGMPAERRILVGGGVHLLPDMELSSLDARVFEAFASTSQHRYLYLCNMRTNVSRWSRNAVEFFGLPGEYMFDAGAIWAEHIHPDDRAMYLQDIDEVFSGRKASHSLEYRVKSADGSYVMCSCRGVVLKGENGEPDLFAGTLTNRGVIESIDAVTGLYNGYEFMNNVRGLLARKQGALVLMLGVCDFSTINSVYDYAFGSRVLAALAAQLADLVHGRGTAYRMDGAKFAVCIPQGTADDARCLYARMQGIARSRLLVDGICVSLNIAGGAMLLDQGAGSDSTVRAAVAYALECSKREGHGKLIFSGEGGANSAHRRKLELMNRIHASVVQGNRGFYLLYQPMVSAKDDAVCGMEALLRWRDGEHGEVSPGSFVPWLENDPIFFELGNWILEQALTDGMRILAVQPDFVVNVNVAYTQLSRAGFRGAVMDALRRTGFPAENLCLELTERCRTLDMELLRSELEFFIAHGIRIALDDFGTGASSMSLLRDLPISSLKIDRAFITDIVSNRKDQAIVEMICRCAGKLDMEVCVEGIESEEVRSFVDGYMPDCYQGYYFARPMKPEDVLAIVRAQAESAAE